MKKKIYFLLTLVILFSSISISALAKSTPTKADNKSIQSQSENEDDRLIKFLKENDVDEITQKKLIEKSNRGELWDSWKSSEGYEKVVKTKDGKTKYIFKDGSICVVGVSVSPNEDDNVSLRSFKRYFNSIYTFFYNSFF